MLQSQTNFNPPHLFTVLEELDIKALPPWNIINENFQNWKDQFDRVNLSSFIPFSRMINDDVIACFKSGSAEVFLFNLPLSNNVSYFKSFNNMQDWLSHAMDDMYDYIINY